jgi:hypothetical protein
MYSRIILRAIRNVVLVIRTGEDAGLGSVSPSEAPGGREISNAAGRVR